MSNDLKNKMLEWEYKPPESTWDKITASLDADEEYALSKKLLSFQSQPPGFIWENIKSSLNKREPGRLISLYQQHKRIFQYTGAAAVLILLAVLTSLIVTNNSAPNELTQQSGITQQNQQVIKISAGDEKASVSKTNLTDSQTSAQSLKTTLPGENDHEITKQSLSSTSNKKPGNIISQWKQAKDSLVNRYFVHTNKNGDAVRFSSKLYGLFECSDEWTENECDQQIRLWQQKAATSAMLASADFAGVLEMLKGMQERQ